MDFKFSKDSGDSQSGEAPGEKRKQSALLVLLLLLVGGFTYLYFFTDLIKPQEGQKAAETPVPVPQIVKMPLPPRAVESTETKGNTPEKSEAPKVATAAPVSAAPPAAKPAPAPVKPAAAPAPVKPAPAPAAKTAPAPAKPKEDLKKPSEVKTADKKPQPAPLADKKGQLAAATTAVVDKKNSAAKTGIRKPGSGAHAKSASAARAKKATTGPWTLLIGNYVLEDALSADMGRVRKAGFEPIVKPSIRKKTTMNRLFVSDYSDRASAQATLEKLKRLTSDAFIIEQGGRFTVFAGSYLQSESARSEKERLNAAGISVTVKHSDIAIPTHSLSIGPFISKNDAGTALGKLKSSGIQATIAQK